MGLDRIIAVDLGKFNSVACVMGVATQAHRFTTVARTPAALHELLVSHAGKNPSRTLLVIETCDAAGWVYDLAVPLGLSVKVANANGRGLAVEQGQAKTRTTP